MKINNKVFREGERPVSLTPLGKESSILCEFLESSIEGIRHIDVAFFIHSYTKGAPKLTGCGSLLSKAHQDFSIVIEFLNTVVVRIGHINVTCLIKGDAY